LNTISIEIGDRSVTPEYLALKELILSRRSTANTNTDLKDKIFGTIEPIQKLTVECLNCWDDMAWHEEVSLQFKL
jgi:hypothetical protein